MKTIKFLPQLSHLLIAVLCTFAWVACNNRPVTKSDVQDDLEDARQATQEAQEETQEAQETQAEFYADSRETKIQELEDRSHNIDQRMEELQDVSNNSSNQAAQSDIASAVSELQNEKEMLNERITEVKSMETSDWSVSYEEISAAIGTIEEKIDTLSQRLESDN